MGRSPQNANSITKIENYLPPVRVHTHLRSVFPAIKTEKHGPAQGNMRSTDCSRLEWQLHILQMGCRGFMPIETKAILMSLGASRRLNGTQFTQLYKKVSTHTIRTAYRMVRLRRALEKNPHLRHANVRRTEPSGWEQTELHGHSGMRAVQEAKNLIRQLQHEHAKSGKAT